MVYEKLAAIIAEQFEVDEAQITPETLLYDELGADDLDIIDIVMSVEDEFGMEVPDEVIEKAATVADFVDFIESK